MIVRIEGLQQYDSSKTFGRSAEDEDNWLAPKTWHEILAAELNIPRWPPRLGDDPLGEEIPDLTLRELLQKIDSIDGGHPSSSITQSVYDFDGRYKLELRFHNVAKTLDQEAIGVCGDCARENFRSTCKHPPHPGRIVDWKYELLRRDPLQSEYEWTKGSSTLDLD